LEAQEEVLHVRMDTVEAMVEEVEEATGAAMEVEVEVDLVHLRHLVTGDGVRDHLAEGTMTGVVVAAAAIATEVVDDPTRTRNRSISFRRKQHLAPLHCLDLRTERMTSTITTRSQDGQDMVRILQLLVLRTSKAPIYSLPGVQSPRIVSILPDADWRITRDDSTPLASLLGWSTPRPKPTIKDKDARMKNSTASQCEAEPARATHATTLL
jgi:hypothetical protein